MRTPEIHDRFIELLIVLVCLQYQGYTYYIPLFIFMLFMCTASANQCINIEYNVLHTINQSNKFYHRSSRVSIMFCLLSPRSLEYNTIEKSLEYNITEMSDSIIKSINFIILITFKCTTDCDNCSAMAFGCNKIDLIYSNSLEVFGKSLLSASFMLYLLPSNSLWYPSI